MENSPIYAIFSRKFPTVGKDPLQLAGQQMITFILNSQTQKTGQDVNLTGLSGP